MPAPLRAPTCCSCDRVRTTKAKKEGESMVLSIAITMMLAENLVQFGISLLAQLDGFQQPISDRVTEGIAKDCEHGCARKFPKSQCSQDMGDTNGSIRSFHLAFI